MALITIGTSLIDVADVALVAPRGAESTVYLADSQQLESALSAAAQAAAVNGTAAGTVLTTVVVSSNFGSCYISGPNTQRVVELGATGTTWYLRGGPGPVICPTTDIAAAEVLIDATGGSEVPYTYSYSGSYTPAITYSGGSSAPLGTFGVSRVGNGAGAPLAGDTVVAWGAISFSGVVDGETIDVSFPFEMAADPFPVVEVVDQFDTNVTASIEPLSATAARITLGVSDDFDGGLLVRFTYQTANAVDPE